MMLWSSRRGKKCSSVAYCMMLVVIGISPFSLSSLLFLEGAEAYAPTTLVATIHGSKSIPLTIGPNDECIEPAYFRVGQPPPALNHDTNNDDSDDHDDNPQQTTFRMKNVPGEGDCMFLSVALAAGIRNVSPATVDEPPPRHVTTTTTDTVDQHPHQRLARELRRAVAHQLQQTSQSLLLIEGTRHVPASQLLQSAATQEQMSTETYLQRLQQIGHEGGLYGGGPELVVLSNLLRRPISIYELEDLDPIMPPAGYTVSSTTATNNYPHLVTPTNSICWIKRMGTFGDTFEPPTTTVALPVDSAATATTTKKPTLPNHLHILILDTSPTEKHACALFPFST